MKNSPMPTGSSVTAMCAGCGRKYGKPWGALKLLKQCQGCKPKDDAK